MGRSVTRNAYSYAGANAINYTDPSGKFFFAPFLIAGLIGVGIGAALSARYYDAAAGGQCACDLQNQIRHKDRTQFILQSSLEGGLAGLGFSILAFVASPLAVTALAVAASVRSADQALKNIQSYGANPCNWDMLNASRLGGIFSFGLGLLEAI